MDQHAVPQPVGGDAGERGAFGGICTRVVSPAGLLPVASSLCPYFGAPAP